MNLHETPYARDVAYFTRQEESESIPADVLTSYETAIKWFSQRRPKSEPFKMPIWSIKAYCPTCARGF